MTQKLDIGRKKASSKPLIAIALLLSLFSFSGFDIYPSRQKQIERTEQVVSIAKSSKKTHSFQLVARAVHENTFLLQLNLNQPGQRVLFYNLSIKIKLADVSKKVDSFEKPLNLYQLTSSRSADEDPFHSIRG